jgi:hypothetical protein
MDDFDDLSEAPLGVFLVTGLVVWGPIGILCWWFLF